MFPYNILSSIVFIFVSSYIIYESSTLPKNEYADMNPGSWPSFLGWLMLILSVLLLVETLIKRKFAGKEKTDSGDAPVEDEPAPFDFTSKGMIYVYVLCVIFIAFSILLHFFNFTIASVFLIPCCMLLLGERRWWMLTSITAGVPILIHIIFALILKIQLP